jgi:predicted transposase/invertase (TIGR01784 family)
MLIAEYSYETDIKVQRREAYREGLAEGIEQGAEQTKIETAKKLISMGLSLEQVAEGTELSLEKVQELAKL